MRPKSLLLAAAVAAILAAASPAQAQQAPPKPAKPVSNPDPLVSQKMDQATALALRDAADAIGMVRWDRSKSPPRISYETVHTYKYIASGTYMDQKVNKVTVGVDFGLPAVRRDVEDASGKRTVTVAAKTLAWDESKPGVFQARTQTPAAERLRMIWIYPPAVIHAAALAPEKVKIIARPGGRELTVPLADGSEIKAQMDAENVITRVELASGGKTYVGEYSEYKQDGQDMDVMFPSRIVQKIDGKVVTDLKVEEHFANPYVIFPTPKELR